FLDIQNNLFTKLPTMLYALPPQTRIRINEELVPANDNSLRFISNDDSSSFALNPERAEAHRPPRLQKKARERLKEKESASKAQIDDELEDDPTTEHHVGPQPLPPSTPSSHNSESPLHSLPPPVTINTQAPRKKRRLKTLNMTNSSLTALPEKLKKYGNVEQLVLSQNQLTTVPIWLSSFKKLEVLLLDDNILSSLPPESLNIPSLQHFNLRGNRLETIPATICLCRNIKHLNIENNQFRRLPSILSELPRLETLRIKGNPIEEFPEVIAKMRNLRKLSLGDDLSSWKRHLLKIKPHLQIS
ncbi:MAG: leucine-rich repeat domain-containing protein, partial [Myxococcota bacterium]|nr:leucine-rich repeat domain-containing protein [Myxococcota bacterium]